MNARRQPVGHILCFLRRASDVGDEKRIGARTARRRERFRQRDRRPSADVGHCGVHRRGVGQARIARHLFEHRPAQKLVRDRPHALRQIGRRRLDEIGRHAGRGHGQRRGRLVFVGQRQDQRDAGENAERGRNDQPPAAPSDNGEVVEKMHASLFHQRILVRVVVTT